MRSLHTTHLVICFTLVVFGSTLTVGSETSNDVAAAKQLLRKVGAKFRDDGDVAMQGLNIGSMEVDALLALPNVSTLDCKHSKFGEGQFERLSAVKFKAGALLLLQDSNITAQQLRSFLKKCRQKELAFDLGYFWESPVSEDAVRKLRKDFPQTEFRHTSRATVNRFLQSHLKNSMAHHSVPLVYLSDDWWKEIAGFFSVSVTLPGGVKRYDHIIEKHPVSAALLLRGKERLDRKMVEEARNDFNTVIARRPSETTALEKQVAHHYLGKTYATEAKHEKALAEFNTAIELGLDHNEIVLERAGTLIQIGRSREAITHLTRHIKIEAEAERRRQEDAERRKKEGPKKLGPNSKFSRPSLTINVELRDAYVMRARAYQTRGEFEQAISDCNRAIAVDSDHSDSFVRRALVNQDDDRYKEAIADWTEVVKLAPNRAYAYFARALCWIRIGKNKNALFDYSLCLARDPEDHSALLNRAEMWTLCGQYERALKDLGAYSKLQPDSLNGLVYTSRILSRCPDKQFRSGVRAVALARRACELTHWKHVGAITELAAACAENGDFLAAMKWAEKAIAQSEATNSKDSPFYELASGLLASYQMQKHVRLTVDIPIGDSDIHQCDLIEEIYRNGGVVACDYIADNREITVTFGAEFRWSFLAGRNADKYKLTAANTAQWKQLQGLTFLELFHTTVEPAAFRNLSRLPGLRRLFVRSCDLSGAPSPIGEWFPQMDSLTMHNQHLDEQLVAAVVGMPKLREFDYWPCSHGQAEFYEQLFSNPRLHVVLTDAKLNDHHLTQLGRLPKLERVVMRTNTFTTKGVEALLELRKDSVFELRGAIARWKTAEQIKSVNDQSKAVRLERVDQDTLRYVRRQSHAD